MNNIIKRVFYFAKKDVLDKRENKMLNSVGLLYGYIAGIPVEEEQLFGKLFINRCLAGYINYL